MNANYEQQKILLAQAGYTQGVKPSYGVYVPAFVFSELNLSGNEALIYSYFYAATQNNKNADTAIWAKGSFQFFEALLNVSRSTVIRCINHLCEKSFLQKRSFVEDNGRKVSNLYAAVVPEGIFANGFEAGINPETMAIPVSYQSASEVGSIQNTTDITIPEEENSEENSTDFNVENFNEDPAPEALKNVENSPISPENDKTAGQPLVSKCYYPWCQNDTSPSSKMTLANINKYINKYKTNHPTNRTTDCCQVDSQPASFSVVAPLEDLPTSQNECEINTPSQADENLDHNQTCACAQPSSGSEIFRTDGRMDSENREFQGAYAQPQGNTPQDTQTLESLNAQMPLAAEAKESEKPASADNENDQVALDVTSADFELLLAITKNRNKLDNPVGWTETLGAYAALISQGFYSWEIVSAWQARQNEFDGQAKYSPQLCKWLNTQAAKSIERMRYKQRNMGLRARLRRYFDSMQPLYRENAIPMLTFDERYPKEDSIINNSCPAYAGVQENHVKQSATGEAEGSEEQKAKTVSMQEFLTKKLECGEELSEFERTYAMRFGLLDDADLEEGETDLDFSKSVPSKLPASLCFKGLFADLQGEKAQVEAVQKPELVT